MGCACSGNKSVPPLQAPRREDLFRRSDPLPCRIVRVVDGDTVVVVTRATPREDFATYTVRLQGVDTPEMRGATALEKAAAQAAAGFLARLVGPANEQGAVGVFVCAPKGGDKYGRLLGEVYLPRRAPSGVAATLLRAGMGRPYSGQAKAPWSPAELDAILHAAAMSGDHA